MIKAEDFVEFPFPEASKAYFATISVVALCAKLWEFGGRRVEVLLSEGPHGPGGRVIKHASVQASIYAGRMLALVTNEEIDAALKAVDMPKCELSVGKNCVHAYETV